MKFSEVLVRNNPYEYFSYGDDKVVRLYEEGYSKKVLEETFEKYQSINTLLDNSFKVYDLINVDGREGIVMDNLEGSSLLYLLENNYHLVDQFAEEFSKVHQSLLHVKGSHLIDQKNYFMRVINQSDLDQDIKKYYIKLVETLPKDNKLCHGNFHLDHLIKHENAYRVLGFREAYIGHPTSDFAKSCLVVNVPNDPENISKEFSESLQLIRERFLQIYKKTMPEFDSQLFKKFYQLAAITRLNELKPNERLWLLEIIKEPFKKEAK